MSFVVFSLAVRLFKDTKNDIVYNDFLMTASLNKE